MGICMPFSQHYRLLLVCYRQLQIGVDVKKDRDAQLFACRLPISSIANSKIGALILEYWASFCMRRKSLGNEICTKYHYIIENSF